MNDFENSLVMNHGDFTLRFTIKHWERVDASLGCAIDILSAYRNALAKSQPAPDDDWIVVEGIAA